MLDHEVSLSLLLLALIGWANLRGLKETGRLFSLPTYAFVAMALVITRDWLDQTLLNQRAAYLFKALSDDYSRVFCVVRYYLAG